MLFPRVMGRRTLLFTLLLIAGCAYGIGPAAPADADGTESDPPPHGMRSDAGAANAPDAAGSIVSVLFSGPECVAVRCPASAPFVVGCADIVLTGDADLACVATLDPSTVAFEQGNLCRSDSASGRVLCSVAPATLGPTNCPLPRRIARYLRTLEDCVY